jgi:hypothetical protein
MSKSSRYRYRKPRIIPVITSNLIPLDGDGRIPLQVITSDPFYDEYAGTLTTIDSRVQIHGDLYVGETNVQAAIDSLDARVDIMAANQASTHRTPADRIIYNLTNQGYSEFDITEAIRGLMNMRRGY